MSTKYRNHHVIREDLPNGNILLKSGDPLGQVAERTTDWLDNWAERTPDAIFLAERSGDGWREVSYADARDQALAIASGLAGLGLDQSKPILILSGNSVDHGLLALAAQYVGVPIVPLPEQYSLISAARNQIDLAASMIQPGAVFAEDANVFSEALGREVFDNVHKISSSGGGPDIRSLETLKKMENDISFDMARVNHDSVAKILMTSGSTSAPKGVPTTHRMMCVNQAQIAHALPFLVDHPPLIVDWLPWNHVFGGSHNFNLMLANGGALYIDGGKPTPQLVGQTLENLRLKTGTMAFNVPAGFAMIRDELRKDKNLRRRYFESLDMLFYSGASLPQDVWADLEDMAREVRGDMPLFTSSWGLTETAPAVLLQHQPTDRSGVIGVPLPGVDIKLIPDADNRCEVRVKGPNIFSGYWDNPEVTAKAFDDEGYFITGDAMNFVKWDDPNLGLKFDGRISEEFKLLSGTWVRAAGLRLSLIAELKNVASDIVITGADRNDIGLFVIPTALTREANDLSEDNGAIVSLSIADKLREALGNIGGSNSTRIARAMVLSEPPSIADGEITAKGNLNNRKILTRRKVLLERLYDDTDPATILIGTAAK